jgi:hypothetical protein
MVLADSIALNLEKGSPIGLSFNRKALDALAAGLPAKDGDAGEILQQVAAQLVKAESALGRRELATDLA